jgi:hypothetical protein
MSNENKGDFFVMLNTQKGGYTPLMLCTDIAACESDFAKFETKEEARDGAMGSVLGEQFGYEIFEVGTGES